MRKIYLLSDVPKDKGFEKETSKYLKTDISEESTITFISGRPYNNELSLIKSQNILNSFKDIDIKFSNINVLTNEMSPKSVFLSM